jgi:hypothetical protein
MPCLMQIFDSIGKDILEGGANFKDHVNWLLLNSLSVSKSTELLFTFNIKAKPVIQIKNALSDGTTWPQATFDIFKEEDLTWVLRLNILDPTVASMKSRSTTSTTEDVLDVSLRFKSSTINYRSPTKEDLDNTVTPIAIYWPSPSIKSAGI